MNSSNQVSLEVDPLLKLCNEDTQFIALIKIITDIEPMVFFNLTLD